VLVGLIALVATAATGCGGGAGDGGGPNAGPASGDGDAGTVTVTVGSGPLAGTHEGTGELTCGHGKFGGDEVWVVFSTDIDDANDVTIVNVYSAPESEKDNLQSPYKGQAFVMDVGIGNFMADASKKVTINGDHPGTAGKRSVDGNTIQVAGTTGDGVDVEVVAHCAEVATS
jgi:hypothetical protein